MHSPELRAANALTEKGGKAVIANEVVLGVPSCCSIPDGGFSHSSMAASKTPRWECPLKNTARFLFASLNLAGVSSFL
jgi:hypothetical protein